ncbi:MAG: response regulator [Lachnospiraceae bacterium]|nr:response regulator [Lachnospiraceae bacterium]
MGRKDSIAFRKNILAFVLMALFFGTIIIMYYRMLEGETKERIVRECEANAEASSGMIDKYLSGGIDCINITEGSLNSMIREKRPTEDILDYLVSQSKAVESVLPEATTGIYGYINGEYLDGDGWVPGEDYDPVMRPWYIKARANMGQIVVVDPYLDAQTGQIITTFAKQMCDAKSVVALDLSLKELQKITEDITGENEIIMVLDRDYHVIAHSNRSEINIDYGSGGDALGTAIVDAYRISDDDSFRALYNNTEYIVYSKKLDNNWICLCATDTTQAYGALRKPLILTVIVSVLVCLFMTAIFVYSDRRERQAEELEEKTQIAVAANNAKTAFLANMSHEIRTPINAILGMNEMVLRECRDEDILRYSGNIKKAGTTLLGIVNDVLDFSRIESGKLDIIPTDYELSSVIGDIVNMIRTRADEKGLELRLDIDGDIPNGLFGDEIRIKQVITNLLTNAVKYTDEGSVTFGMRFSDDPGDADSIILEVFVKDTGTGIRPEDMDKLLAKFERLEEKKNRSIEGTGLGLSIAENLLELMGSKLLIDSEYGRGSVFSFFISQKVTDRTRLGDHEAGAVAGPFEDRNEAETFIAPFAEILAVDDNPINLGVFRSLVKRTQVITDTALSGAEAVKKSAAKKYDIIFLDHMMPEMDGIETLEEIRGNKSNPNAVTPVICLTANAVSGAREFYISAGFNDYITKPVDPVRLEEMMVSYLPEEKVTRRLGTKRGSVNEDDLPAEFAPLNGTAVDAAAGIKNSGGALEYMSVLKTFDDASPDRVRELNKLFDAEDYETYTIKMHALKSSLRLIGAAMLGDRAQDIESAGKNMDHDYIKQAHGRFMEEYESLIRLLQPVLSGKDVRDGINEDRPPAEPEMITASYDKMREAAEEMDCDRLADILSELDRYTIGPEHKERIERLRSAVRAYEYGNVLSILDMD